MTSKIKEKLAEILDLEVSQIKLDSGFIKRSGVRNLMIDKNKRLCFKTPKIAVEYEGKTYKFGTYEVEIDLNEITDEEIYVDVFGHDHPHADSDDNFLCRGNMEEELTSSFVKGDINTGITIILSLLNTYTPKASINFIEECFD
jgi:hypothetical protein